MAERIISAATALPVGLDELKQHRRAEGAPDGITLESCLSTACQVAEQKLQRCLVMETRELVQDRLCGEIRLPMSPVIQVLSVKYIDDAGAVQTLAPSVYQLDNVGSRARVVLAYGQSWPAVRGDVNGVTVRYLVGYATPVSVDVSTDVIALPGGRTVADGDVLRFSLQDKVSGVLPTGLTATTDVYAVESTGATFKVAATPGGAAINLSGAPAGVMFLGAVPSSVRDWIKLMAGTLYENRETEVIGTIATSLKYVDRLLDRHAVPRL